MLELAALDLRRDLATVLRIAAAGRLAVRGLRGVALGLTRVAAGLTARPVAP